MVFRCVKPISKASFLKFRFLDIKVPSCISLVTKFEVYKATATQAIFHSRLQCNFQKSLNCHGEEKIATRLHGVLARFADSNIARILRVFSFSIIFLEDVALPAQDVLHKEICTCDGNAIVSSCE